MAVKYISIVYTRTGGLVTLLEPFDNKQLFRKTQSQIVGVKPEVYLPFVDSCGYHVI